MRVEPDGVGVVRPGSGLPFSPKARKGPVMTVRATPAEMAEKWSRRLSGATEDVRLGVERVTESPMVKASAAKEKMVTNFQTAMAAGKYEQGLARVSLADWKSATLELGLPRLAAGAARARPKFEDFARDLLPHIDQGMAELERMSDVTLEDSITRMVFWTRHMAEFRRG